MRRDDVWRVSVRIISIRMIGVRMMSRRRISVRIAGVRMIVGLMKGIHHSRIRMHHSKVRASLQLEEAGRLENVL